MDAGFLIFLILLAVLAGASYVARLLDIAPAILFLLAGITLAFVPAMPEFELPPELVLLVALPPLIYYASVAMSWREFRFNLRPITLLAVAGVIFIAVAVATAVHVLLGLPWAIGFLLGAIVAPSDIVAPLAVARKLKLPRRIPMVLEGEGVANDATALILYRFATTAIVSGTFSLSVATAEFAAIMIGEVAFGLAVGWLSLHARQRLRDPRIEITLSILTPYVAFWAPQHLGGSGVIATLVCGLYVSWNGWRLIPAETRLQSHFFWDLVNYLIESFLFLLTGFQMRLLFEKSKELPLVQIAIATLLVTAIVVISRFVWVYPVTYLPRWLSASLRARDPAPPWQWTFILSYAGGVRGAVSLAAALAIPLELQSGAPFPHRDLILFVAFGVILLTVVVLGLSLTAVVEVMGVGLAGFTEDVAAHDAETAARREALEASRKSLAAMEQDSTMPGTVVRLLRARHTANVGELLGPHRPDIVAARHELTRKLIAAERQSIHAQLLEGRITDETMRRIERDLDLEEAALVNQEYRGPGL